MMHSVFWSLVFGFVMAVSFVLAMPDLAAAAKDGANAWFNLFNNLPAPTLAARTCWRSASWSRTISARSPA